MIYRNRSENSSASSPRILVSVAVDFLEVLPRKSCFQWPNSAVSVENVAILPG
jgi:hypothetical protein